MMISTRIKNIAAAYEKCKNTCELKGKTRQILNEVHRTKKPVVVTINGKPDVVLVDAVVFEKKLKALNLKALLQEAEEDIKRGRVRPAREFLKDFKRRADGSVFPYADLSGFHNR